MAEIATAYISILPSMRAVGPALSKGLDAPAEQAGKQAGEKAGRGFGSTFAGGLKGLLGPLTAVFAGGAAVGFFTDAIGAASDLEQSIGGVGAVFGDVQDEIHGFAKAAAQNVGLSQNAYNGLAAVIGTGLRSAGVPMDELAAGTDALITRAADLSAVFGGPVSQSSEAMGAALRGEFEPLRQYGVVLSQAEINARALADSGKASASALTAQEKAAATTALIMEKSATSAGQFANEADTLAGRQERLRAEFENVKTTIGGALLPAMSGLLGFVQRSLLPGLTGAGVKVQAFGRWLGENKTPILAVAGAITAVFLPALIRLGVQHTIAGAQAVAAATRTAVAWAMTQAAAVAGAAAQWVAVGRTVAGWVLMGTQSLIQAARMAAAWFIALGPVGWVIAAVVGLAALIIANWDRIVGWTEQAWTAVTAWLSKAWENIKTTASNVWNAIVAFFKAIPGKLVQFFLNFTLPGLLIKHWDSIKNAAVEKWNAVVAFVKAIPGRIVSALGNMGSTLYGAGRDLIQGLLSGAGSLLSSVGRFFLDKLPGWIVGPFKAAMGIASPSKVFASLGGNLAEGLALGMDRDRFLVTAATNRLVSVPNVGSNLSVLAGGDAGAGDVPTVRIARESVRELGATMLDGATVVSHGAVADRARAQKLAGLR